jgi:DNA-binding sugar fermentation-stimulating protein
MENTESFRAHWETDLKFAELLKEAAEKGVKNLAYDTLITEDSITLNKNIEIRWGK